MSEQVLTAAPKYAFPDLAGNAGTLYVDPETGVAWIGLNLPHMDPLAAFCVLDSTKGNILGLYKQMQSAPKLVKPGIAGMFDKIKKRFS